MSKAGAKGGSGRDSRLASALRDNLRRRKAAVRPSGGPDEASAGQRENATPPANPAAAPGEG